MPERTDKLVMPSLDVLWAHLRANPHVEYTMRHWCDGKLTVERGKASFSNFHHCKMTFVDWSGKQITYSLSNGLIEYEWSIRFFPGGFRFRRRRLSFTVRFSKRERP